MDDKIKCDGCGQYGPVGRLLTECCSGASGCDCHGDVVDLGICLKCKGTGFMGPDVDPRINLQVIMAAISPQGYIGSGPL